jgi:hypothetical protein
MKRVAYLGGYFPAEQSIRRSFTDHKVEIVFPYCVIPRYPMAYEKRGGHKSRSSYRAVRVETPITDPLPETGFAMQTIPSWVPYVPDKTLLSWLEKFKPDVIVHRYYLDAPHMHHHAREAAVKLGIPYVVYRMETWPLPGYTINYLDCDLFLYANTCDEPLINQKKDWWCWGVSQNERNLHIPRNTELAAFGLVGHNSGQKHDSLSFYAQAAKKMNKTIYVYWGMATEEWGFLARELFIQPTFSIEEQTEYMNGCKVAINYESVEGMFGCWSYKLWQTMSCGTPTITRYKPEYLKMFDGALLQCNTDLEARNFMSELLHHNDAFWQHISKKSEEVVHDKYEWFTNFDRIMREHNLW